MNTLAELKDNIANRITGYRANETSKQRLIALGLHPNAVVRIVNRRGNNLVVAVGSGRIAIGKDLAQQLMVEPV